VERYYRKWSGTTALRYYRGAVPGLLPPLTEDIAVVGAVVATVLPPGGTTALPGGTTALRYYRGALPSLLPPLTEVFAVVGAVVATVLPPGGTTALPGGTTA
jgi:hypothetical protein